MIRSNRWFKPSAKFTSRRSRLRVETLEDRCTPAVITVTSTADTVAVDGTVTLREAIESHNAGMNINGDVNASGTYGNDTIVFNIAGSGVKTIDLTSALPSINGNLTINGFTQAGAASNTMITGDNSTHNIEVNASALGTGGTAFKVTSGGNTTIEGLAITGAGIGVDVGSSSVNTTIEGNFIGINAAGTTASSNAGMGVLIEAGATGVTIGGSTPQARNIIAGNSISGIVAAGASATIEGNYFGLNAAGTSAVANTTGIDVTGNNNVIGGTDLGAGNVISGNITGILDEGSSTGLLIQGDLIGTSANGTAAVANQGIGVSVTTATNATIGGTTLGAGNVIADNAGAGISIQAGSTGDRLMDNQIYGNTGVSITSNANESIPVILSATSSGSQTFINGTVTGAANAQLQVQLYATAQAAAQGQTYLGSTTVTTNASGMASFSVALSANVTGKLITATAMNVTSGESSAFSSALLVQTSLSVVAEGAGANPTVLVLNGDGSTRFTLNPFPGFTGAVTVATGDVNGDGTDDIVVAQGAGGSSEVKVYDGVTGLQLTSAIGDFHAFASTFSGGVNVAVADVTGDGKADIIVGAGPNGGPEVEVFNATNAQPVAAFFAFATTFTGGVTVAGGHFNSDAYADIVVGAGASGGPEVKVLDGTKLGQVTNGVINSSAYLLDFFAFSSTFTGGVYVAAGDLNGDGTADIVVGAGQNGGPEVRTFNGINGALMNDIMAFSPNFTGGVRVATADLDGSGQASVLVGAGAGSAGFQLKTYRGSNLSLMSSSDPFDPSFLGGVYVG